MAANSNTIAITVTLNSGAFVSGAQQVATSIAGIGSQSITTGAIVQGVFSGQLLAEFFEKAAQAAREFFGESIDEAAKLQTAMLGLKAIGETIGVSDSQTEASVRNLELVRKGLVTEADAAAALRNLLIAGFGMDHAIDIMNRTADAAAGTGKKFGEMEESIARAFEVQQVRAFKSAGILFDLHKSLENIKQTTADFAAEQTDGAAHTAEYNDFMQSTAKFTGDAERATDTYAGAMTELETAITNAKVSLGELVTGNEDVIHTIKTVAEELHATKGEMGALAEFGEAFGFVVKEGARSLAALELVTKVAWDGIVATISGALYLIADAEHEVASALGFKAEFMKNLADQYKATADAAKRDLADSAARYLEFSEKLDKAPDKPKDDEAERKRAADAAQAAREVEAEKGKRLEEQRAVHEAIEAIEVRITKLGEDRLRLSEQTTAVLRAQAALRSQFSGEETGAQKRAIEERDAATKLSSDLRRIGDSARDEIAANKKKDEDSLDKLKEKGTPLGEIAFYRLEQKFEEDRFAKAVERKALEDARAVSAKAAIESEQRAEDRILETYKLQRSALEEITKLHEERAEAAGAVEEENKYVKLYADAARAADAFHEKIADLDAATRAKLEADFQTSQAAVLAEHERKLDDAGATRSRHLQDLLDEVRGVRRGSSDTDIDRLFRDVQGGQAFNALGQPTGPYGVDPKEAANRLIEAFEQGRVTVADLSRGGENRRGILEDVLLKDQADLALQKVEAKQNAEEEKRKQAELRKLQEDQLKVQKAFFGALAAKLADGSIKPDEIIEKLTNPNVSVFMNVVSEDDFTLVNDGSKNNAGRLSSPKPTTTGYPPPVSQGTAHGS